MHDDYPTPDEPEIEQATTDAVPPMGSEATLSDELKSMGQHFAAALRAAASTQEAQELRGDLREGLRALREDIDEALAKAPVDSLRERASRPPANAVRGELAGAIRALNRALDRLAQAMEREETDRPQGG